MKESLPNMSRWFSYVSRDRRICLFFYFLALNGKIKINFSSSSSCCDVTRRCTHETQPRLILFQQRNSQNVISMLLLVVSSWQQHSDSFPFLKREFKHIVWRGWMKKKKMILRDFVVICINVGRSGRS